MSLPTVVVQSIFVEPRKTCDFKCNTSWDVQLCIQLSKTLSKILPCGISSHRRLRKNKCELIQQIDLVKYKPLPSLRFYCNILGILHGILPLWSCFSSLHFTEPMQLLDFAAKSAKGLLHILHYHAVAIKCR